MKMRQQRSQVSRRFGGATERSTSKGLVKVTSDRENILFRRQKEGLCG